ncbi:MAG: sigma-54 dependent transcriptional regulator [Gallionella sp.]|nr:sigma-54 dependent transcriptional regulator [Gallionella sp.]
MSNYRICLIEDDLIMGEALSDRFQLEDFHCDWFKTGAEAIKALTSQPYHVVICDIQLPDINGETLFKQLKSTEAVLPHFIFTTGYGTIDRAVRLLKLGAQDYLTKPLDIHALLASIQALCSRSTCTVTRETMLGVSSAMRNIEALLPRIAKTPTSVLITGESGVGKERLAHALRNLYDPELKHPFITVNCGALTESLLEAELFGYTKGAFTGAIRDKRGLFELASGGTLFLDEVGEMSPAMQVKLLRAIQERQIVRVGAETPIQVDIKLICATHQDLKQMVEIGKFREDLYYRIHVIHLSIPPLRERKEDIPWLAENLLAEWNTQHDDPRTLSLAAEQALLNYPWPRNVRELKHCLERACILSQQRELSPELLFDGLPPLPTEQPHSEESLSEYIQACERKYIGNCLRNHNGHISETANSLGISRKNLWEKMKKLGI